MPELAKLRLQDSVRLGVVYQVNVIGELRCETDCEYVLHQRDRMSFDQIAAGERAGPSHRIKERCPQRVEIDFAAGCLRCLD